MGQIKGGKERKRKCLHRGGARERKIKCGYGRAGEWIEVPPGTRKEEDKRERGEDR